MEIEEHYYADDPTIGPPDVKTNLRDVQYYFLGNGFIQAAVQVCPSGDGTALGLALMHPEKFGPKRRVLNFDPAKGLQPTQLVLFSGKARYVAGPNEIEATWADLDGVPAARISWRCEICAVVELFYCPDQREPRLVRQITLKNLDGQERAVICELGTTDQLITEKVMLPIGKAHTLFFEYRLVGEEGAGRIECTLRKELRVHLKAVEAWKETARCWFSDPLLSFLFDVSKRQLPAVIAHNGAMDASIWQYNLEWTRDQAFAATALLMLGQIDLARTVLARLLKEFVSEEGDAVDSGRRRPTEEIELDQNGIVLLAVKAYYDWTNDLDFIRQYWHKIKVTADLPLKEVFRHQESGLLHNRREFWERHALYGIQDGMELAYQMFPALGLESAAYLAEKIGEQDLALHWRTEASRLKQAMLNDKNYGLVENGVLIKRRSVDGQVQKEVQADPSIRLHSSIPLAAPGSHFLNPDSSSVLPIALEFIDPKSDLAAKTLQEVEKLWNQSWDFGGYSRYNVTSEPDSPGPWPFASLFIARAYFEAGDDEKVWRVLRWLKSLPGAQSGSWFEFYGPRPCPPCPQVGIIPWTWAELTFFFIHHLFGIRPQGDRVRIRPRLLTGLANAQLSIRIAKSNLELSVQKSSDGKAGITVGKTKFPYSPQGIELPLESNRTWKVAVLQSDG